MLTTGLFWGATALSAPKIAFFEARDAQGNLVTMEKGGRYLHVAISVGDKWLHAHPYWGVQLVNLLSDIGDPALIVTQEAAPDLTEKDIKQYLHQKYDTSYSWAAKDKTYCSKLLAQILNLPPTPMRFSGSIWKNRNSTAPTELGISPDDIYRELKWRGYRPWSNRCEKLFVP
ncbi:Hypothetical protein Bdt_1528 [Bdellovibrio bacteriovorus str. Tiberius]|uniref:Uncharacterized protein n=1 Tax=Bdellovibrio bacteriovorus str. Tiberius TaxID=1069642 RepID=K7Z9I7_BDEBC|nr:Hypothetical protein Bdt_1528 [Bdellovibrio bacteriovorus str. Tiberius]